MLRRLQIDRIYYSHSQCVWRIFSALLSCITFNSLTLPGQVSRTNSRSGKTDTVLHIRNKCNWERKRGIHSKNTADIENAANIIEKKEEEEVAEYEPTQ